MNRANKEFKMFNNPVLELLATSGPAMMITFHLIIISILLYIGYSSLYLKGTSLTILFVYFISGIITWSIAEYLLHRYLFHFVNENKFIQRFHFAMHGYHHNTPNDANRLFMPPLPAAIFLSLFFGLFYLIIGNYAWVFLPGFELGYLLYSFVHYSIHTRKAPKGFEKLWHHHILHHYKEHDKAYGVSSRFWDRIFGTMPAEQ